MSELLSHTKAFLGSKASWMGRLRPLNFVHEATSPIRIGQVKEISECGSGGWGLVISDQ